MARSTRISPEAPTPVLAVKHNAIEIGGAGKVARNIAALGATLHLCRSCRRRRRRAHAPQRARQADGAIVPDLVVDRTRPTTRKVRFVSEHHSTHLLRADWEDVAPASAESQAAMIAHARSGAAAGRRGGALRLRQGRADRAGHPRRHRGGAPARHAGDRRSEVPRLSRLSRGDHDHAQRARNWPPRCHRPVPQRGRDRRRRRRACADGRAARPCWSRAARRA